MRSDSVLSKRFLKLFFRTKTDDPEKEKMKAKAKEIQRIEQETIRHQEANRTALEAIGGPKKRKFGEVGGSGGGGGVGGGPRRLPHLPRQDMVPHPPSPC